MTEVPGQVLEGRSRHCLEVHPLELDAGPEVEPRQLCIVVEHLLEVGHEPVGIDAVAGEASSDLVVDAAGGHLLEGLGEHRLGVGGPLLVV